MNYITSGFFCTPLVYVFPTHSTIKQGYRPVNLSADATALQNLNHPKKQFLSYRQKCFFLTYSKVRGLLDSLT